MKFEENPKKPKQMPRNSKKISKKSKINTRKLNKFQTKFKQIRNDLNKLWKNVQKSVEIGAKTFEMKTGRYVIKIDLHFIDNW